MNTDLLASYTELNRRIDDLIALERQLVAAADKFGLKMKSAPPATYSQLRNSPASLTEYVLKNVKAVLSVFQICSVEQIDPWDDREFFRLSMKGLGLSFPSDFLNCVSEGDVIEGYDFNRKQIFRNMAFMQNSGYSLVEMLANEWPTLFDRASIVTEQMISFCDDILWKANKTIPFNIPIHYVRERESAERLLWEISFRYLSPLFSGPNKPFGILGTFRLRAVESSENESLAPVTFI